MNYLSANFVAVTPAPTTSTTTTTTTTSTPAPTTTTTPVPTTTKPWWFVEYSEDGKAIGKNGKVRCLRTLQLYLNDAYVQLLTYLDLDDRLQF